MHLPRVLCEAYLKMFSMTSTGQEWVGFGSWVRGGDVGDKALAWGDVGGGGGGAGIVEA